MRFGVCLLIWGLGFGACTPVTPGNRDAAAVIDQARPGDLAVAADLSPPLDLRSFPDLVAPADLRRACGANSVSALPVPVCQALGGVRLTLTNHSACDVSITGVDVSGPNAQSVWIEPSPMMFPALLPAGSSAFFPVECGAGAPGGATLEIDLDIGILRLPIW